MSSPQTEVRTLVFRNNLSAKLLVLPTIHPGVLISAEEILKPLLVKKGAVLISRWIGQGQNRRLYWTVVNGGYYAAVRLLTKHVPGAYDREEQKIQVYQDTLDEAVELTWCVVFSSPQEMKERYEKLMRSLVKWRRPLLEIKRQAIETIDEASTLFDRRDRFNPSSRSPMVLAAASRFSKRSDDLVSIRHDIHGRLAALIVEKRRLWKFIEETERMLRQFQTHWRDGNPPTRGAAKRHAGHFRRYVQFLDEPYVAPVGRRTLQRLKWDFQSIADVLEAERFDEAFELIDKALNSIYLVRVRADMEDALLKLTQLIESGADCFAPGEQVDFYVALYEFRQSLGKPDLEKGFARSVLSKVLLELDLAIAEAKLSEPNLKLLRGYLKKACEPI